MKILRAFCLFWIVLATFALNPCLKTFFLVLTHQNLSALKFIIWSILAYFSYSAFYAFSSSNLLILSISAFSFSSRSFYSFNYYSSWACRYYCKNSISFSISKVIFYLNTSKHCLRVWIYKIRSILNYLRRLLSCFWLSKTFYFSYSSLIYYSSF